MVVDLSPAVAKLVEAFRQQRPTRGGSLIITVYGDVIAARGGTVWLGSLIELLEPLGLNPRLVRTAIFRLSKEGWLSAAQTGRRSYYSLTDSGKRRFGSAFRRIYAGPQTQWDGVWHLAITSQANPDAREALRKELGWQGFGLIASGVMAHPKADLFEVIATLQELGATENVVLLSASSEGLPSTVPLKKLVRECWQLDELAKKYDIFLERFRPVWQALSTQTLLDPLECFVVRILLIHEYRRVLLRDPDLPADLLDSHWEGSSARLLCRNLYRLVYQGAEEYLSEVLETADGPLPEAGPRFYERFGGLEQTAV